MEYNYLRSVFFASNIIHRKLHVYYLYITITVKRYLCRDLPPHSRSVFHPVRVSNGFYYVVVVVIPSSVPYFDLSVARFPRSLKHELELEHIPPMRRLTTVLASRVIVSLPICSIAL